MLALNRWIARRSVVECLLLGFVVVPLVHGTLIGMWGHGPASFYTGMPYSLHIYLSLVGMWGLWLPWVLLLIRWAGRQKREG